ncbi:hypothetical protein FRC19_010302 [Serendipita sp. 401]|nr:hypothetical protein FRC19_010302 [Serendipita sp. 401]
MGRILWASSLLLPVLTANALIFELPSFAHHKRASRHHELSRKTKRAPTLPATWSAYGCVSDGPVRTLTAVVFDSDTMTVETCVNYCDSHNYRIAGLEYSRECYCDNDLQNGATTTTGCDMLCNGDNTQTCGGGYKLSVYRSSKTGPAPLQTYNNWGYQGCYTAAPPSASAWTSVGCYTDAIGTRTLSVPMGIAGMTPEKCQAACQAANYVFAGVEYGAECYCGAYLNPVASPATDGRCNMPCGGDATQSCGGPNGIFVYQRGEPEQPPAGPSVLQTYGDWAIQGCFLDSAADRSLPVGMGITGGPGAMSVEACCDACQGAGYSYSGLEYSGECFCGNTITAPRAIDNRCNMPCYGKPTEICGGPNGLTVYEFGGTVWQDPSATTSTSTSSSTPVQTQTSTTVSTATESTSTSTSTSTESTSTSTSTSSESTSEGTSTSTSTSSESTSTSTSTSSDSTSTSTSTSTSSSSESTSSSTESSTSTESTSTSTSSSTSSTPTPTGPSFLQSYGNWESQGCWSDNPGARSLPVGINMNGVTTPQKCMDACYNAGYNYAGMEYAAECYCGTEVLNGGSQQTDDGCNMLCNADPMHYCGGPFRLNMYKYNGVVPPSTNPPGGDPAPVGDIPPLTTGLPNPWRYSGCWVDNAHGRILPFAPPASANNSPLTCIQRCVDAGYTVAGMEYSQECYCGNSLINAATKAGSDAQCNMGCSGDNAHACGGANRITLYSTTDDFPVYPVPDAKTENLPGHFEYVGCYSQPGGGQLPVFQYQIIDFVGTTGVRFYTPDGSPGVNGTNDWEEHWDQIHLQQGRWYPGAMVMANGSILIVGGEEGSNGAPVPSLEVLPKPEGGPTYLTMDWLLRTDPNNLYPFLYVLPGKGIFIIYFNEARILDEKTFETIKTFPIIPGAVTGPAGRVYPLEGSSMILPQHAPYTDPVEILTCGGSAFGLALDNCVSIEPEGAGEWIIERMPSKRVMTITTALPDGTYMIMGGAKAGVAGFGLANTPNLQAIMYDPSKPRHQRFSILGETSVARMYHSEAILLHDGRVLVTGSDPQDQLNPQEYRMEVYVPPYLTDGRVQPSYTIVERDWVFEGTYNIQVTLPQGPISQMRVSLVGASSTTHGATYGQRTFFPAFSCNGNSCQVTAPPGPYICPPGWYMLFILDGPTPSHSQWVRIGGDIGNLGSWPNTGGFVLPGMGGIEQ